MSTQKALYLLEPKGQYAVQERDIQEPGPGEVLVEIHATALNPSTGRFRYSTCSSRTTLPFSVQTPQASLRRSVRE
ncbi:uncharacterized protein PHACADRAFT_253069 [Phanerochaete carnosa HHB-10118-sp]|uniref:Uncharacterized protein n=1 Tax=Phanerochaete carnosa (strain HHB-10118-sp) TaxID=650164 RepID=K5X6U3_PHACS|nr:uncharacterized protein PHACADRAFT_253069 [Phanerochaete carnosa HHB-10118-sp]EKM58607.1 hypothetical protein PHACADRAFT_253069 [Phanerochaete carnosa HHB-10118-sp]